MRIFPWQSKTRSASLSPLSHPENILLIRSSSTRRLASCRISLLRFIVTMVASLKRVFIAKDHRFAHHEAHERHEEKRAKAKRAKDVKSGFLFFPCVLCALCAKNFLMRFVFFVVKKLLRNLL